jgi:mercuric ion binding protein
MFRIQLTALTFCLAVSAVAAASGAADGAASDDTAKEVRVQVEGLACPFCTYNIEKRIKTLEGYEEDTYEASVEEGWVTFGWKEGVPFDEEAVREQIRKAGFTPGEIETKEAGEQLPLHQDLAAPRLERELTTVLSVRFQF